MIKNILLGTACSLLFVSSVLADDSKNSKNDNRWYAGLDVGYSLLGKEMGKNSIFNLYTHYKNAMVIDGRVGYDFGVFRFEGEVSLHNHNARNFTVITAGNLGFGNSPAVGKAKLSSFMVNAVFDLGGVFNKDSKFEPFIGIGAGLGDLRLKNIRSGAVNFVNGDASVIAYQMFAGIRYALADNLNLTAKYRYMATPDTDFVNGQGIKFKTSYDVHDFMLGLSYKFGAASKPMPSRVIPAPEPEPEPVPEPEFIPTPEPEPAPEPEPEVNLPSFKIYFDFDSSKLTVKAEKTIKEISKVILSNEGSKASLAAHTDSLGTIEYNTRLGMKRGAAVKAALVKQGIDLTHISVINNVEENQEVVTKDNVKNSYNRRVIIILLK